MSRKLLALGTICVLILLSTLQVNAHDWYSASCCGSHDCHPITSCSEILEQAKGWVSWQGHNFSPDMIHPSEDSKCHVCILHGYMDNFIPRCIYVQQGS
jgi:hypothetical protein